MFRTVRDIPLIKGVPILLRSALNVPVEGGEVTDTYRLHRALPTIQFLLGHGARLVIAGHIGRAETETLLSVHRYLSQFVPLFFSPESSGPQVEKKVKELRSGEALLLENLRRDRREITNDKSFALELASLADVFVEDDFDACHRAHASIVGVPTLLPSYAGLLLEEEIKELRKALKPESPSLAVVGGVKFHTKEPALKKLITLYDHLFVGGALANDFLAAQGHSLGRSLVSDVSRSLIEPLLKNKGLVLPVDTVVRNSEGRVRTARVNEIKPDETIMDHGPETLSLLLDLVSKSKTILWNGPLGNYENGFTEATDTFARATSNRAGASGFRAVVGGGDTVAVINKLGVLDSFSFISTGGGAMLEFLAKGTLPGIEILG